MQQLREGQLVGRMMLQRLVTGATGVKQARYRRRPTRGSEALARACAVYTQPVYSMEEGPWHLLFNVRQRMVYMISAEGFALKCSSSARQNVCESPIIKDVGISGNPD